MAVAHAIDRDLDRCAIAVELDAPGLRALMRPRAGARGVLEQHEIELIPLYLVRVRPGGIEAAVEAEDVVAALVVRGEIGAEFFYTDSLQGVTEAEALDDRHVHRQERLANVEAGMPIPLDERDLQPFARQQRGRRRARRPAAHDEN